MTAGARIALALLIAGSATITGCDADGAAGPAGPAAASRWELPPVRVEPPAPPAAVPVPPGAIDATTYGAAPGIDSRVAIQAALDEAAPGGAVTIPPAGAAYLLTSAGPNPLNPSGQYSLRIPRDVTLHIAPGATLQLADDQQSDAGGPVDLIVFDADDVAITGGGKIRGNTEGQSAWSGGYQQITAGCLVRSFHPSRNARVTDLTLEDAFSNPVNLEGGGPARLSRLRTSATGEGPQVIAARGVVIEDIEHDDLANVTVGDGVEVSVVEDFVIRRVRLTAGTGGGAGSAVDVFGSSHGTVSDVLSVGWAYGIEVHDFPTTTVYVSDDVTVHRSRIVRAGVTGILSGPDQRGSVRYANIEIAGGGIGVQVFGPAGLPVLTLDSLRIDRGLAGLLVHGSRAVVASHGVVRGSHPLDGVLVEDRAGGESATLTLRAFSATESTRNGVRVEAPALSLRIEGGRFDGNQAGAYHGLPADAVILRAPPP